MANQSNCGCTSLGEEFETAFRAYGFGELMSHNLAVLAMGVVERWAVPHQTERPTNGQHNG